MPLSEIITWLPVSDPPLGARSVLICSRYGDVREAFYKHKDGRFEFPYEVDCTDPYFTDVTLWAEMPKGPTAEERK